MKWTERLPFPTFDAGCVRRIDVTRRDHRDAVCILVAALVIVVAADVLGVRTTLFRFAVPAEGWEVDGGLVATVLLCALFVVYAVRRIGDLSRAIDARRNAETDAWILANHDGLTGLVNRHFFFRQLGDMLARLPQAGDHLALLTLDINGFKAVNESHGHVQGDQALVEIAQRLMDVVDDNAVVARLGGDEFAIAVPATGTRDQALLQARTVAAAIAAPIGLGDAEVILGAAIGVALAPHDADTPVDLLRRADLALSRAKRDGGGAIRCFEPEMDIRRERRARIEQELRLAIPADTIELHYQPLVELRSHRIIGFEALARWTHPELGIVSPAEFISVAEESGLIRPLGDRLLLAACREAARWPREMILAFNLSPVQLADRALGLRILSILQDTGLDPRRLELEITESAFIGDVTRARETIDQLRAAGVRFALDDFGTGYATITQLLSLRFDKIKIDRSFVHRTRQDNGSAVVVRAIVRLASGLGLTTIAEGVEDVADLANLKASGCDEGQGYLFGRPVPAAMVPGLIGQPVVARSVA